MAAKKRIPVAVLAKARAAAKSKPKPAHSAKPSKAKIVAGLRRLHPMD